MKKQLLFLAIPLIFSSCNFSKSVKVDLVSGLTTAGDKLTCDNVFITYEGKKTVGKTWIYGQSFLLNFNDLKGLTVSDGKVFPDMDLIVTGKDGDTVMSVKNMYSKYPDGVKMNQVDMSANLVVADPVHSGKDYKLEVVVYDRKDKGTFRVSYDFSVKRNEDLKVLANKISFNELYLFSGDRSKVINDGNVNPDEKVYLVIEGLKGFTEENGKAFPGLSIRAEGADGSVIFDNSDLFASSSETGISASDVKEKILPNITFSKGNFKNPVNCTYTLWDKRGEAKLIVSTALNVK